MPDQCFRITTMSVRPGLETDGLALMDAAISLVEEQFGDPKHAAGQCCLASFADLPSGASYIVEISVRIDPADGEAIIRTEAVERFDNAADMRKAFRELAAHNSVS